MMSRKKEIAYLVGKIMGDGHLEKNLGSCFFISGNFANLYPLADLISHKFEIDKRHLFFITNRNLKGTSYKLRVNNTAFCKLLYANGAPKGNKVFTPFLIPEWIYNNKQYAKSFLQGILEDELSTIKIEKSHYSVKPQFKMIKIRKLLNNHKLFINQIKSLLEAFSIQCGNINARQRKDNPDKFDVYFHIQRNKKNILRFQKAVGFGLNKEKALELRNCCKILKKYL